MDRSVKTYTWSIKTSTALSYKMSIQPAEKPVEFLTRERQSREIFLVLMC